MRVRAALAALLALSALAALGSAAPGPAAAAPAVRAEQGSPAPPPPVRFGFRKVVRFAEPVDMTGPPTYALELPGSPGTMIVATKDGLLYAVRGRHVIMPPFLDLSRRVNTGFVEQGFYSFAFAPDYVKSGRLYVAYTNLKGDFELDELRRGRDSRPDPETRRRVLQIKHRDTPSHNGGQILFHGGLLYVGVGDGGTPGDIAGNAQNLSSLLGKILRIDPRQKGKEPYRIPPGNPFVGRPGRDEVYAYGLRNPFRFDIAPRPEGGAWLAIGDVGQDTHEEIDMTTLQGAWGVNFGWPYFEGPAPYRTDLPPPPPTVPPVVSYTHDRGNEGEGSCSVTGGIFVSQKGPAPLRGQYVYADLCENRLRVIAPTDQPTTDVPTPLWTPAPFSFTEASNGRIYFTSYDGWLHELGFFRTRPRTDQGKKSPGGKTKGGGKAKRAAKRGRSRAEVDGRGGRGAERGPGTGSARIGNQYR